MGKGFSLMWIILRGYQPIAANWTDRKGVLSCHQEGPLRSFSFWCWNLCCLWLCHVTLGLSSESSLPVLACAFTLRGTQLPKWNGWTEWCVYLEDSWRKWLKCSFKTVRTSVLSIISVLPTNQWSQDFFAYVHLCSFVRSPQTDHWGLSWLIVSPQKSLPFSESSCGSDPPSFPAQLMLYTQWGQESYLEFSFPSSHLFIRI